MVKAAWFRSCAPNERPDKFDRIVQSWETANQASELSPHPSLPRMRGREGWGCTSWGIKDNDLYLLHVLRKRMEYPELKRAVREQCKAFAANVVLIEDKASGTQLIQKGVPAVTRYQPQSDKIMRMQAQNAMIENGFVHLPKEAAWLVEYLHELTIFLRASTTTSDPGAWEDHRGFLHCRRPWSSRRRACPRHLCHAVAH